MTQVTGVITKRYDNETNVVLELNGQRYSDYEGRNMPADAKEGCTVSFDMIEKGIWKNVAGPVKVDHDAVAPDPKTGAAPVAAASGAVDARQRMIIRQACVKASSSYHSDSVSTKETVVETARYFESYADGSLDLKELDDALGGAGNFDDDIAF